MSPNFQRGLNELVDKLLELGRDVNICLDNIVRAVENHDARFAEAELWINAKLKTRGMEIDKDCMILQARQDLVASDFRLLYTVQSITNHVVHVGTLCKHTSCPISETVDHKRGEEMTLALLEMACAARGLFWRELEVFREHDLSRARDLRAADDQVDILYSEAMKLLLKPTISEAESPEWRMWAALILHYLERIADHGVDIGGRTVFLVTGERMEDAMRQYLDHYLRGSSSRWPLSP